MRIVASFSLKCVSSMEVGFFGGDAPLFRPVAEAGIEIQCWAGT